MLRADAEATQRRRIGKVHFVGIGGAGMSGIAEVLVSLGYRVSGSDLTRNAATEHLEALGVIVYRGHAAAHLQDADAVVRSSAVPESNPEIVAARARHLPVVPRAEMLGELMRHRIGVAVAGTHGKTTTTSLVASIFQAAGRDPTYVIGGVVQAMRSGARLGQSSWFIAEADESDASFLFLQPLVAVITNVDDDHLGTYGGDRQRLGEAFVAFCQRVPFYGRVVLCGDDPGVQRIAGQVTRPVLTYGLSAEADIRARILEADAAGSRFVVSGSGRAALEVALPLPGRHNVSNALAAIAVAFDEGIEDAAIVRGLAHYAGVGRRFEIHDPVTIGEVELTLVDDYGHHPNELSAVIETARAIWPGRRLVMVFQPHRYSRTAALLDEFAKVLAEVDALALLEVYGAGEPSIEGADADALRTALIARGAPTPLLFAGVDEAAVALPAELRAGDVLITQGAGDISVLSRRLRGADELE